MDQLNSDAHHGRYVIGWHEIELGSKDRFQDAPGSNIKSHVQPQQRSISSLVTKLNMAARPLFQRLAGSRPLLEVCDE
jgi:hypothetical protein